jgi:hypothetical protein
MGCFYSIDFFYCDSSVFGRFSVTGRRLLDKGVQKSCAQVLVQTVYLIHNVKCTALHSSCTAAAAVQGPPSGC